VPEGQKADLIDGVIYLASPDNTDAGGLFTWLSALLHLVVEAQDAGNVYGSRVAFRINKRNSPEPDIGFVKKQRLHLVRRGFVRGAPNLAIEIVSTESVERDYKKKRKLYQKAGVSEYWIIDPDLRTVLLLRLDGGKRYREVRPKNRMLHSRVIPGFWLRVEWLWSESRPKVSESLQQILS
jgi:Uma2 family endonuclease